jgi:hypothetical protein
LTLIVLDPCSTMSYKLNDNKEICVKHVCMHNLLKYTYI